MPMKIAPNTDTSFDEELEQPPTLEEKSGDFASLLYYAQPGDILSIEPGVYQGEFNFPPGVILVAEMPDETHLKPEDPLHRFMLDYHSQADSLFEAMSKPISEDKKKFFSAMTRALIPMHFSLVEIRDAMPNIVGMINLVYALVNAISRVEMDGGPILQSDKGAEAEGSTNDQRPSSPTA